MRTTSLASAAVLLLPAVAAAHVKITSPTPRSSTVLKERHCGMAGLSRANVKTVAPGSVLHVEWDEYIAHPGWYRISFQQNGDVFEIPPASNGADGNGGASNYPTEDLTGKADPVTGSIILADRIQHPKLALDVTLPNVECTNCTLQLIQMMTDKPPYTIDAASNDIYFACVDLVLSANAPADPGTPTDPGEGMPTDPGDTSGGPGSTSGGCSAGGESGAALLAAAALLARRRRAARA